MLQRIKDHVIEFFIGTVICGGVLFASATAYETSLQTGQINKTITANQQQFNQKFTESQQDIKALADQINQKFTENQQEVKVLADQINQKITENQQSVKVLKKFIANQLLKDKTLTADDIDTLFSDSGPLFELKQDKQIQLAIKQAKEAIALEEARLAALDANKDDKLERKNGWKEKPEPITVATAERQEAAQVGQASAKAAKEQAAKEQAAKEQAAKEQAAKEQAAKEQAAKEHTVSGQLLAGLRAALRNETDEAKKASLLREIQELEAQEIMQKANKRIIEKCPSDVFRPEPDSFLRTTGDDLCIVREQ